MEKNNPDGSSVSIGEKENSEYGSDDEETQTEVDHFEKRCLQGLSHLFSWLKAAKR